MENKRRGLIQVADRYARNKDYHCLFPGCTRKAVRCHAVPRFACYEALADTIGHLYTISLSKHRVMKMADPADPQHVVKTGVGDAGVFKGFCATHDTSLFLAAETNDRTRKNFMLGTMHARALSVEYCRKRYLGEFYRKLADISDERDVKGWAVNQAGSWDVSALFLREAYLAPMFNLYMGRGPDSIEYFCYVVNRNVQVSCCGIFTQYPDALKSILGYNLISFRGASILSITTFKAAEHYLHSYLSQFNLPSDAEKLFNDIAFSRCEDPLIAAKLWRSLSEDEKRSVCSSLRPPNQRIHEPIPQIIKVTAADAPDAIDVAKSFDRLPPNFDAALSVAFKALYENPAP